MVQRTLNKLISKIVPTHLLTDALVRPIGWFVHLSYFPSVFSGQSMTLISLTTPEILPSVSLSPSWCAVNHTSKMQCSFRSEPLSHSSRCEIAWGNCCSMTEELLGYQSPEDLNRIWHDSEHTISFMRFSCTCCLRFHKGFVFIFS